VKVKVRVRLDIHGCFTVSSASMVESLPQPPADAVKDEPMETAPATAGETNGPVDANEAGKENDQNATKENDAKATETPDDKSKTPEKPAEENKKTEDVKKPDAKKSKKSTKSTDLTVSMEQSGPGQEKFQSFLEVENELISEFRLEKDRADAKNSVEEYVYYIREKLHGEYEKYATEDHRTEFSSLLSATEDWLYEEGEEEKKQAYVDKLAEVKKFGDPIQLRFEAYRELPSAFEVLGASITHLRKVIDLYSKKDEKYAHIEEEEMKKVHNKLEEKFKWFNEKMQANAKCLLTSPPVVYPSQILTEKKLLNDFCNPIINKPKPKVEPPKDDPKKEDKKAKEGETTSNNEQTPSQSAEQMETDNKSNESEKPKSNLDMEVD